MTAGAKPVVFECDGYCTCCSSATHFQSTDAWLRDHFICTRCASIPRERALLKVIDQQFPNWKAGVLHESSPGGGASSARLARECPGYFSSHFFAGHAPGSMVGNARCENLEALTFSDESIDLHVTQDVMEHVLDPHAAFREIARTLKPGGAHVFTAPLVNKANPTLQAARREPDGSVTHLMAPEYHGNPIDPRGSLVTWRWGFDIARHIFEASGLFTEFYIYDDLSLGIRAEYIEVMVSRKPQRA